MSTTLLSRKQGRFLAFLCAIILLCESITAYAASFDPAFYAATYPDVAAVVGTDPQALYDHYINYGMKEGRLPYNGAKPGPYQHPYVQ